MKVVLVVVVLLPFSCGLIGLRKPYQNPAFRRAHEQHMTSYYVTPTAPPTVGDMKGRRNIWLKITNGVPHVTAEKMDIDTLNCSMSTLQEAVRRNIDIKDSYHRYSGCLSHIGVKLVVPNTTDALIGLPTDTMMASESILRCTISCMDQLYSIKSCVPVMEYTVCITDINNLGVGPRTVLQLLRDLAQDCLVWRTV